MRCLILVPLGCFIYNKTQKKDRLTLAPYTFKEECLIIQPSQFIDSSFEASAAIDFNIHYHQNEKVFYPLSQNGVSSAKSSFRPNEKRIYCLLWQNTGEQSIELDYQFKIQGKKEGKNSLNKLVYFRVDESQQNISIVTTEEGELSTIQ